MMNKKTWLIAASVLILMLMIASCTSTAPVFYSNNSQQEFTVLGEVTYTMRGVAIQYR